MTAPAWIAVAGLAVALLVQFGTGLFHLGRHSQRLSALEERTEDIGSLAVLASSLAEIKAQLVEVRHDVKNLLTGRVRPASRAKAED